MFVLLLTSLSLMLNVWYARPPTGMKNLKRDILKSEGSYSFFMVKVVLSIRAKYANFGLTSGASWRRDCLLVLPVGDEETYFSFNISIVFP